MSMKFGPKSAMSPSIGDPCLLCGLKFRAGDYTTLMATQVVRKYSGDEVEVHWECREQLRRPFKCEGLPRS